MQLIENHSTQTDIDSRQIVWFGRKASIQVDGTLGTGGAVTLHWRPSEHATDIAVGSALVVGNNDVTPNSGFLFVRFKAGSAAPSGLTVAIYERPVGY